MVYKQSDFLTPAARSILERAISMGDNCDLVQCTPGEWWLDVDRVDARPCWRLVRLCLISISWELTQSTYWIPNEEGRKVIKDPKYIPESVKQGLWDRATNRR